MSSRASSTVARSRGGSSSGLVHRYEGALCELMASSFERNTAVPETLPVLPLRETVLFPATVAPILIGQERSLELVNDALGADRMIALVAQKSPDRTPPDPTDLYTIGTMALVHDVARVGERTFR